MDLAILLLRTLFFYLLIMLVILVFTKRRKMTLSDLLIAFMVAQFSVLAIDRPGKPLFMILLPVLFLLLLHLSVKPFVQKEWNVPKRKQRDDLPWKKWKPEGALPHSFRQRYADVEMAALDPVPLYPSIGQLPLPLILDGKVLDHNLVKLGKTRFWLKNEVQRYGVKKFKEVSYCSIDRYGRTFLDKKKP